VSISSSVADSTEAPALPVITMPAGLPAFTWARRFVLVPWGSDDSPYSRLQCLDDDELAFVVVEPSLFFPDYEPELDDAAVERLALRDPADALVLVILTVGEGPHDTTANLLGPVVVNWRTRVAEQVILADSEHGTRVPLAEG
jgi:flagellar assembly factor FliW